jgi:hypothetical protein
METSFSETLIGWKSRKPLMSLYGTEWKERGYGLRRMKGDVVIEVTVRPNLRYPAIGSRLGSFDPKSSTGGIAIFFKQILMGHTHEKCLK